MSSERPLTPKVSVVIPCYNHGEYIDEAVESVLNQTCRDFEIIIVNDGSTDEGTNLKLRAYDRPRTRVMHTRNMGLPSARNNGIREAKGEFILPLDADDRIGAAYMEEALKVFESRPNTGIVYCEAAYFGTRDGAWDTWEFSFERILLENMIFCSAFFRRADWEKSGGYRPNMVYGFEDWDFWLSLIELGREVYKIPRKLFFYRTKDSSMIGGMDKYKRTTMMLQNYLNHKELYGKLFFEKICDLLPGVPCSQLFIDTGMGFSEEDSLMRRICDRGIRRIEFDLGGFDGIRKLRFDPINDFAAVRIDEITVHTRGGGRERITRYGHNGTEKDGYLLFATDDPQIYIDLENIEKPERLTVSLDFVAIGPEVLKERNIDLEKEVQGLKDELAGVYESRGWKLLSECRRIRDGLSHPRSKE